MSGSPRIWLFIIAAVLIAVTANALSAVWAGKEQKLTPWLVAVVLIAPFVFITFGLVASRIGLSLASATVDSLLTISTILVGLFLFRERASLTAYQYVGIILAIVGIILMHLDRSLAS